MPNELFLTLKTYSPLLLLSLHMYLFVQPPIHSFNNLFHLSKWYNCAQVIETQHPRRYASLLSLRISFPPSPRCWPHPIPSPLCGLYHICLSAQVQCTCLPLLLCSYGENTFDTRLVLYFQKVILLKMDLLS